MKTTIIGLGLIGGSIALELRKSGIAKHIYGVDNNTSHAQIALERGIIHELSSLEQAIANSDLIVLATPVNMIHQLLPTVLDQMNNHAIVMDVGSTKSSICQCANAHPRRGQFIAAHPIAGTEFSGPQAAQYGLFKNKTNIICEREKTAANTIRHAMRIFDQLGMNTIFMQPEEHDKHVAYVSHLSHVSSFLLGQTVLNIEKSEKNIFLLTGSGFASTVRLAKSSPDMWAPIFEENEKYLGQALQEYIHNLQKFHDHLMNKETQAMHRIMTDANEIRRVLNPQS